MCILQFCRMPARLENSIGLPKALDPRRENKVGAFVLIKSAFWSVPSAMNCRAITLHGEDQTHCENEERFDGGEHDKNYSSIKALEQN